MVGGRLASRRYDGRYADIGAAYLTADDPAFAGRVESWRMAGLIRPWTDTLTVYEPGRPPRPAPGPVRWAAPGGLRSLAEDLARELDVTLEHEVTALPAADAVVLAMPGPQALRIADARRGPPPAVVAGAGRGAHLPAAELAGLPRSVRERSPGPGDGLRRRRPAR